MFAWKKQGLTFATRRHSVGSWMDNSALTPTPFRLDEAVIRVFAGFRDRDGVSRIGYVDLDASDPRRVIGVSPKPVLDIGRDGCFDDNGVILGDVVRTSNGVAMFYVGFQRVAKVKFLAYTGLAWSNDEGRTFARVSDAPILDRCAGQTTIRAVHSVMRDGGRWRIWLAAGDDWEVVDGKPFPRYHIRSLETDDLRSLGCRGTLCLEPQGIEYRVGRPRVYRIAGHYLMYFTKGDRRGSYVPGMAWSDDGKIWKRADCEVGIAPSLAGWDSQALCYPALIQNGDEILMVYNGNAMGLDGFGLASAPGRIG